MKRSSQRILTTHAGSLPRPADLLEMVRALADGLSGFEPSAKAAGLPWSGSKEYVSFPEFYAATVPQSANARARTFACTGPIAYRGHAQVKTDIENLKAALAGV